MNIDEFLELALKEELTKTNSQVDAQSSQRKSGRMRLTASEDLVISGTECFEKCLRQVDPDLKINWHFKNGDFILRDQSVASVQGDLSKLLKVDRLALNFLKKLSGVATLTRLYSKKVSGTHCKITETFNITPLLGFLEKQAVIDGGGYNRSLEQLNRRDNISLNQLAQFDGLANFLSENELSSPVCVEVNSIEAAKVAIENSISCIVFRDLDDNELQKILPDVPAEIITDYLGELSLERTEKLAQMGFNYLSIEDLTQSAPWANFSFFIEWGKN